MRWRLVIGNGLSFPENENKSVGFVHADRCEILPSGVLCFYKGDEIAEAFGAGTWLNVSKVTEQQNNTSAPPAEDAEEDDVA